MVNYCSRTAGQQDRSLQLLLFCRERRRIERSSAVIAVVVVDEVTSLGNGALGLGEGGRKPWLDD
jgi:hypothetical protein